MERSYQIVSRESKEKLAELLVKDGQVLLPLMELLTEAQLAVDELIDVAGRAALEAVLTLSGMELAGPKQRGKPGGEVRWHGRVRGRVSLSDRKLGVARPRLRHKRWGEVEVPAYRALRRHPRLARRMEEILLSGVSTRRYARVIPEMAETVGVKKSSVSREFVEASAQELKRLCERRFDQVELLAIYIDGLRFGAHQLIVALGVDRMGKKQVLGLREGATENATVVRELLVDLRERGVKPGVKRLFVIDGSKALRQAIDEVFGGDNPVQRCRVHKQRNVREQLPREEWEYVGATMRAAYRLPAEEGMARLKKLALQLEEEHPSAAASLLEGLEETFTVSRLALPPALRRSLSTTNLIENPHAGLRARTRRVCRWTSGKMVERWAAAALLDVEKHFRRIMGYEHLWMLAAALGRSQLDTQGEVA
jgi:transposase-like protein